MWATSLNMNLYGYCSLICLMCQMTCCVMGLCIQFFVCYQRFMPNQRFYNTPRLKLIQTANKTPNSYVSMFHNIIISMKWKYVKERNEKNSKYGQKISTASNKVQNPTVVQVNPILRSYPVVLRFRWEVSHRITKIQPHI